MKGGERIDVVYTWVDGAWPGYPELLRANGKTDHDLNPNRYRDDLETLRYSLRSLEQHLPWHGEVVLVTCRPQLPPWLDTSAPGLRVVHHDEFIDPAHLPTFNSFAIVSNLHRIPGLSERFLYVEDDRFFGRAVERSDLWNDAGQPRVFAKLEATPPGALEPAKDTSPWNAALSRSNGLLDKRYGQRRRGMVKHTPVAIDRGRWQRMIDTWPEAFEATSSSRFRAPDNVAPEHLYPWFLLHESEGEAVPLAEAYRKASYLGVDNWVPIQLCGLAALRLRRPQFFCLNDNFGEKPSRLVAKMVRRFLEHGFPQPSRFERSR